MYVFLSRVEGALLALAARPLLLAAVCFAANALFMPYLGIIHDAELYAGQTLNRVNPGCLDGDLFFKFGSQDRFSAFSPVAAPLVKALGVPTAFGLIYLVSIALYLFAAARFALAVFPDRRFGAVAAVLFAVVYTTYGGLGVFHVPEPFTTPRVAACGFSLLGLERMLRGKPFQAAAMFAAGMALHPLMAVGPAAAGAGLWVLGRFGWTVGVVVFALAVAAAVVAIAVEPVGLKVFGPMSPEWKAGVRRASLYNFVDAWTETDWVRIGLVGATLVAAVAAWPDRRAGQLWAAAAAVGAAGLATFAVAPERPFALLFQGQGYRATWLWEVWYVPLTLGLAVRLWPCGPAARFAAVALCVIAGQVVFTNPAVLLRQGIMFACFVPIFRLAARPDRRWEFAWQALLVSEVLARAMTDAATEAILPAWLRSLSVPLKGMDWPVAVAAVLSPTTRLALLSILGGAAAGLIGRRPLGALLGFAGVGVVINSAYFVVPETEWYRRSQLPIQSDLDFVRWTLAERDPGRRPAVYWPGEESLWQLWGEVGCDVYYNPAQVAGSIFNPGTAAEAVRRAGLVRPFAAAHLRQTDEVLRNQGFWTVAYQYGTDLSDPPPTADDLFRLAADPDVDWIVLPQAFPGLFAATNDSVWVYDARHLRSLKPRP